MTTWQILSGPAISGLAKRWLVQFLVLLIALPPAASAQATPAAGANQVTQSLKVTPLAGNNEMNDLERRVFAPLVVQVLDQENRPVEGADVTFRFPVNTPGATFVDGKNSVTVKTNVDGQASAVGWTATGTGRFQVQVTATRGNEIGSAVVIMTNVTRVADDLRTKEPVKHWYSSKWVKIGLIAGAGAVATAVILANRGGSTTLTAVPGFPTIGGIQ